RGDRLRILTAEPAAGPDAWAAAKCVAAHALTAAQVAARVAHQDYEWASQPAVPVVAALLADVGMLRVPPVVFAKAGPLDADQRAALTDCLLMAEQGLLDRDFAEYLLALGFHPVGTVVELTDGRVAVVAANHAGPAGLRTTTRPVVAVLSDADGRILPRPAF